MKAINPRRAAAGRKGGLATLERHGQLHFIKLGMMGGRPKALTIEDIRLQTSQKKVEGGKLPGDLKTLKEMCKQFLEEGGFSSRRENQDLISG
jgi:hypothetical protein